MSALDAIEQALREQPRKPPLEKWHPPLSGDIDIHIDTRGNWYHENTQIKRQPLINLFASILRREDDGHYYLVTPVEKWRIRVDDTPLLAVDMDIVERGEHQKIIFRLNTEELVLLDKTHRLHIGDMDKQPHPVLYLDYGLVDAAQDRGDEIGVVSAGEWFLLSKI
jgi:uncharacterized protein